MTTDLLLPIAIALFGLISSLLSIRASRKAEVETSKQVTVAQMRVEQEPDKIQPTWNLARVTLEAYFNRNLSQVTAIFWLCVVVMFIGFVIIIWGITLAVQSIDNSVPAIITGVAGIVTEFLGATFLVVFRSTAQQAANYTKTLERINSVGMAMQILDTIPNDAQETNLKESTKVTVIKFLMQQVYSIQQEESTPNK